MTLCALSSILLFKILVSSKLRDGTMAPKGAMLKRPASAMMSSEEAAANGVDHVEVEAMCYWHAHEILSLKIVCIFVVSGSCSAMWLQPLYSLCGMSLESECL